MQMAQHKCFGAERVTTNLIKGQTQSGTKKPVQALSLKHQVGRISLLHRVLATCSPMGLSSGVNYQACFDYALQGYKHQTAEVRNHAYTCLLEIYKVVGPAKMK